MREYSLYIAACTKAGGIYHYYLSESGRLRLAGFVAAPRPMYLIREGQKLYVLLRAPFAQSDESGVQTYAIRFDGSLRPEGPCVSALGKVSAHLAVKNGQVYTANYSSGSIAKLPSKMVQHMGHGPNAARQDMPHPHFIAFTPDKSHIAVADLGLDTVFLYNEQLEAVSSAKVPDGSGARHLAFSPKGDFIYCINEMSSDVTVFSLENRKLSAIKTVRALPQNFAGLTTAAAVRLHDGELYVSHRGYDHITRFLCEDDQLTVKEQLPCGGCGPRDFSLCGDLLVTANEQSNNVVVYRKINGCYQCTDEAALPSPLCVMFADRE